MSLSVVLVAGSHGPAIHYWQAAVLGLIQGVSELFPVSSLGHTVILPALFGWHNVVAAESRPESFWLAFIVGLHVGTALALLAYYWRDWVAIVRGLVRSLVRGKIENSTERLGWLLVTASVPAGILGLVLEHELRVLFTKPLAASVFLMVNALILFGGEVVRRRSAARVPAHVRGLAGDDSDEIAGAAPAGYSPGGPAAPAAPADQAEAAEAASRGSLATLRFREAVVVGFAQILALIAGISRSGVTMVAGLARGLDHEDAARFSFLLATPLILAAGVFKLPDLTGHLGDGVRGQTLVGAACAAAAAIVSVSFLVRWFRSRTLWPFGVYCLVAGAIFTARFA